MKSIRPFYLSFLLTFAIFLLNQFPALAAPQTAANLQELQTIISSAMHARQTSCSVTYTGTFIVGTKFTLNNDISNIIKNIYDADNYLEFSSNGVSETYTPSGNSLLVNFTFDYIDTAEMESYVDTTVDGILSKILSPGMNDYQKEKAIHDWIEANVSYDTSLKNHSDYAALVSPNQTVCQGYALLTDKMMTKAGIETRILVGKTSNSSGSLHTWNEVKIDGVWYQLDTTWDDPVPDVPGQVKYDYYNLTDAQIKIDHSWTGTYPAAKTLFSDTLNAQMAADPSNMAFYQDLSNALGLQYLSADLTVSNPFDLSLKMQDAINNKQAEIKVRYSKKSTFAVDLRTALSFIHNIYSYSYYTMDYRRTTDSNDEIVDLTIKYNPPISVTSVSLSRDTMALSADAKTVTGTLTATVLPANASNATVIWTSSDPNVATVTNGVVKPVNGGTTVITATSAESGQKATCTVTVTQKVSGIALDKSSAYVKLGDADLTLLAAFKPSTATDKRITWTSSNTGVATVDGNGKVHAVAVGTATIKAISTQDPTKTASCKVTVPVNATGVSVKQGTLNLKMGTTSTLTPVFTPANATIKTVTWSSSNTSVVTVAAAGKLTPVAPGTATVTVTSSDGNYKGTCTVTVIYGVTGIKLSSTSVNLKLGDPDMTLTATVNPSNATIKSLTWTSSNTKVAIVDGNGKVHVVAAGTAIIKAISSQDPSKTASCTIKVT